MGQRAVMWLLGGLAAVFVLLTLGVGLLALTSRPPGPAAGADRPPALELRVGQAAPDFALPDDANRTRRLSELDGEPSVLLFLCGCGRCYLMVSALQEIEKQLHGETPRHLVVTTMSPAEAESWQQRTGFQALFLFEKNSQGPVIHQFAGHPCPRVYVLDSRRSIRYISPSPEGNAEPEHMKADLAAALRVSAQEAPAPAPDRRASPRRGRAGTRLPRSGTQRQRPV